MKRTVVALLMLGVAAGAARADDKLTTFALWEPDGYMYPGKVEKTENGKAFIRFADGETAWVPSWGHGTFEVKVGIQVYANYQNKGLYYEAKIVQRDGNEIRVQYAADGVFENTSIARIRMKLFGIKPQVGMPVMGRWTDGYWYPGVIKETDGAKFKVRFDDGDEASLEEKHLIGYRPTFGDRIQGNWKGGGVFFPGKVTKRKGEQVYIKYDDGDEEWTTMARIRADYGLVTPKVIP